MYITVKKLILASASPRRQAYLQELGIEFHIAVADIDEKPIDGETALNYVARMAEDKYKEVAKDNPSAWVLAADTTVYLDEVILGKPKNPEDAERILMLLRGRAHNVATAFCLGCKEQDIMHSQTVISRVVFSQYTRDTMLAYINTGESSDKAGAYGVQGKGAVLVEELRGSYSNVVGLPLSEVVSALDKYGIVKVKQ